MLLIHQARIVNEGRVFKGSVLVNENKIEAIFKNEVPTSVLDKAEIIDAEDCFLLPGLIDDHVHFRDPGLTQKGDLLSESKAAVAGGITSVMDMPNTIPQTTTNTLLEEKHALAASKSLVNYSFYLGATCENFSELQQADPKKVCGIKLFMGSSTGNMLVKDPALLQRIFSEIPLLIAIHSEDETSIQQNIAHYKETVGENIPIKYHSLIRSAEACYKSTSLAIDLAKKHHTRLHILHVSTAKEAALFENLPLDKKNITAEVCPHYLWFDDSQYETLGAKIKCNPAIKTKMDKEALLSALNGNKIDVIGTDHAPHLLSEKEGDCLHAASGIPQVQHALPVMLELAKKGKITIETVVEKMCHNPAKLFNIEKRGFIRKGYYADLVIVERNDAWKVTPENCISKCGWSPYERETFSSKVAYTIVNGKVVYNKGSFDEKSKGMALNFVR